MWICSEHVLEFCNLMFSMLSNNFSRQNFGIFFSFFFFFFFFFFQNTGFDISCKLSPKKTICLKFQSLSSWKNKKISPIYDLLNLPRDYQKVFGPCTLGITKSRNCAIISQYNHPLSWCTFSNAAPVCLPLQNRSRLPVPLSTQQ